MPGWLLGLAAAASDVTHAKQSSLTNLIQLTRDLLMGGCTRGGHGCDLSVIKIQVSTEGPSCLQKGEGLQRRRRLRWVAVPQAAWPLGLFNLPPRACVAPNASREPPYQELLMASEPTSTLTPACWSGENPGGGGRSTHSSPHAGTIAGGCRAASCICTPDGGCVTIKRASGYLWMLNIVNSDHSSLFYVALAAGPT